MKNNDKRKTESLFPSRPTLHYTPVMGGHGRTKLKDFKKVSP